MAISFKGAHFPQEIILLGVRWYLAYPLSYRQVEELREERGVDVDHATRQRWVVQDRAQLAAAFHRRKRSVCRRGRMDETAMTVKGQGRSRSRAVATHGQTIDFVRTEPRDTEAALRFLKQAIRRISPWVILRRSPRGRDLGPPGQSRQRTGPDAQGPSRAREPPCLGSQLCAAEGPAVR